METEKMEIVYQEIGTKIDEIIPGEWNEIYLYAELLEDSTEAYFFFTTPKKMVLFIRIIFQKYMM